MSKSPPEMWFWSHLLESMNAIFSPHDGHADAADGPVDPRHEDEELEGEAARSAHGEGQRQHQQLQSQGQQEQRVDGLFCEHGLSFRYVDWHRDQLKGGPQVW